MGIEPMTSSLPRKCSTSELHRLDAEKKRAGDETRTRDPNLGRVMLYQLSYSRVHPDKPDTLFFLSVGRGGFEPPKSYDNRFTVCPSWPLWYLPDKSLSV